MSGQDVLTAAAPIIKRANDFEHTYDDWDEQDPIQVPLWEIQALRAAVKKSAKEAKP
jgi:hypothetical protein